MVAKNPTPGLTISAPSAAATSTTPDQAANSTPNQTGTGTGNSNNNSLSAGAIAGVAIGSAVVGALIAGLITFLLMKRSKRLGSGRHRHSRDIDFEKIPTRKELPFEENLLERADDSHIRKSMQDLCELIDQHVENYYHLNPAEGSQANLERRLVECGYDKQSALDMTVVLKNPKTRYLGVRRLIAVVIVRNIDFRAKPEVSLLPPQIAAFSQSIPPVERQPGCVDAFDKAFTKWRHLSAFLLSPARASRDAPSANQRELQVAMTRNISLINNVLSPFVKPGAESQRSQQENLTAIIFEGAQLGLLLFCQPLDWMFGWTASTRDESNKRGKDGIQVVTSEVGKGKMWVVFPGIGEWVERQGRQRIREVATAIAVKF